MVRLPSILSSCRSSCRSSWLPLLAVLAAGCGGGSGDRVDHGSPSAVYPAEHPAMAQVEDNGGHVQGSPVFVPVTYANDDLRDSIDDFTARLGSSAYWTATTAEYGVGPGVLGTALHLTIAAPPLLTANGIEAELAANLDGTHPEWPNPTTDTLYLLFYPEGTRITGFGESCTDYGAYHSWVHTAQGWVAYAIMPRCHGWGDSDLEVLTVSASHEMVEAVTDPFGDAWYGANNGNGVWDLVSYGGELTDYCEYQPDAYTRPDDVGYLLSASWSNAAAAAGHNPCQPTDRVFFGAAPVLTEKQTIDLGGGWTESSQVVHVPNGESATIELDLFSDADTGGPFTVAAEDLAHYYGYPRELSFSFDRASGVNGEKVYLTITRAKKGQLFDGGSVFFVVAKKGGATNFWPVYATD